MRQIHYHLVDVFTDRPFGGNQLAVFADSRMTDSALMQAIAKELNLSETTFVLPPQDEANDFWVRIFTPAVELPMAGHPTVGTAFALAHAGLIEAQDEELTLRFEEGVGVIPVTLRFRDGALGLIEMGQPLPAFGPVREDRTAVAEMLSLTPADLMPDLPLEAVSCGVPFLFVPVRDLAAMQRIGVRVEVWQRILKGFAAPHIFAFTPETETAGATVHARMFAPAMGILEDPATGAASGPLGCYLVRHGLVEAADTVHILSEQGFEMGRPSFIHIEIEQKAGEITAVTIGGESVYMGAGYLQVFSELAD